MESALLMPQYVRLPVRHLLMPDWRQRLTATASAGLDDVKQVEAAMWQGASCLGQAAR